MQDPRVWLRGGVVAATEAKVSLMSPAAQFGLNIFEGIRCYVNSGDTKLLAFRLDDHLRRLETSAALLSIPLPHTLGEVREAFGTIVGIHNDEVKADTAVRVNIFGDGQGSWSAEGPFSMIIWPAHRRRTDLQQLSGVRATISSWCRIDDNSLPPRVKVGANYINGRYAQLSAAAAGFDLPILLGRNGNVAESAGACLFLVRGDVLITPAVTSSILESITRDTIIKIALENSILVEQRDVARTEVYVADEVFLCGTAAEVTPIVAVDQYKIGRGCVGLITRFLLEEYHSAVSGIKYVDNEWTEEVS